MKTKKEIFRKPLELFVKRGYDHTPMSLLTKELGLCRGGLYHHFPSKESLLFYVIEKLMEERFVPILEESKNISDPEKRLEFFIKAFTKLLTKDDATRIVLHDSKNLKPQHYEKIRRIWRRTYDLIKNTISEMEKSGKINRHNKAFSAFAVIGMCSWTFYWFDYSRKKFAEELGETFVDILLRGLLKRN